MFKHHLLSCAWRSPSISFPFFFISSTYSFVLIISIIIPCPPTSTVIMRKHALYLLPYPTALYVCDDVCAADCDIQPNPRQLNNMAAFWFCSGRLLAEFFSKYTHTHTHTQRLANVWKSPYVIYRWCPFHFFALGNIQRESCILYTCIKLGLHSHIKSWDSTLCTLLLYLFSWIYSFYFIPALYIYII